jgi:hypothetical protein
VRVRMPESANARECEWARVRMPESVNAREYEWPRVRMAENANGRECEWARVRMGESANGREREWARARMGESANGQGECERVSVSECESKQARARIFRIFNQSVVLSTFQYVFDNSFYQLCIS